MGEPAQLIAAIGAVSRNGMLGLAGWLPWDIPEELDYFERTVAGAALVIGRLTYESMDQVPVDSFIVSRQREIDLKPGCRRVDSVEAGLRAALATGKPVFVIGGASIYAAAWRYCHRFYLTRIDAEFDGDTAFPVGIPLNEWPIVADETVIFTERKQNRPVACRFLQYRQPVPKPVPQSP